MKSTMTVSRCSGDAKLGRSDEGLDRTTSEVDHAHS
jgi:hypothetical protein